MFLVGVVSCGGLTMCKGILCTVYTSEHSGACPCTAPPDESSRALYVMHCTTHRTM